MTYYDLATSLNFALHYIPLIGLYTNTYSFPACICRSFNRDNVFLIMRRRGC